MSKLKTIKREILYDLVWSVPMTKLAKRFDLSDQGLAKKCKKHNIPRPPMGYWAKLEHGKAVKKTLLPSNTDQALEMVEFQSKLKSIVLDSVMDPEEKILIQDMPFQIPMRVNSYHPLIKEYRKIKDNKSIDQFGRLYFRSTSVDLGFKITPATFNRACLFLHGIVQLFDSYGWKLEKDTGYSGSGNKGVFVFEGEKLGFELKEPVTLVPIEITQLKRKDGYLWPTKEYTPTGILEFSIEGMYWCGFQARWKDTTKEKLEDRLTSIVQGFRQAFEYRKLETIKRKARELEWEQKAKRNQELLRLKKVEEAKRDHLFELAQAYEQATSIRKLLLGFKGLKNSEEDFDKWLDWAEKIAGEIDPMDKQSEILFRYDQIEAD